MLEDIKEIIKKNLPEQVGKELRILLEKAEDLKEQNRDLLDNNKGLREESNRLVTRDREVEALQEELDEQKEDQISEEKRLTHREDTVRITEVKQNEFRLEYQLSEAHKRRLELREIVDRLVPVKDEDDD